MDTTNANILDNVYGKPAHRVRGRMHAVLAATMSVALSVSLTTETCWADPPKPAPTGSAAPTSNKPSAALAVVVGTRVALPMPPGFAAADRFTGFQNRANGASIMVSEIPGPFDKVTAGFDAEHLKTKGMNLVSQQVLEVGGHPGVILQVTQDAYGQKFRKWLVAFGDNETVLLTASWPEALTGALQASLKECLLRVKWDRSQEVDPAAGLSFSITPAPPLKFTKRLQNMLLFTPSGELEVKTQGNPMFVVGPSIAELDVGDHSAFAHKRLKQAADLQDFSIKSEQAVTIGGFPGWELLASATDARTQLPRLVYQTILFGNKVYYIMQGMVDWSSSEEYEQAFKDTARRFKLK